MPFNSCATSSEAILVHASMAGTFIPLYYNTNVMKMISFSEWWNQDVIFSADHTKRLRRQDVVLYMANNDGGSHVDEELEETYAFFSRQGGMETTFRLLDGDQEETMIDTNETKWKNFERLEAATVRQIGHEVLHTVGKQIFLRIKSEPVFPSLYLIGD